MDPYPHLIYAGTIPTAQEHASILAAKQAAEAQHADLRKHIQLLNAQLAEAQDHLQRLEQQIDAHARLISPLRRIPSEILRDIFAHASPFSDLRPLTDRVLHAPWTTMQVCKHWHDVCLEYGSLWSNIVIDTVSGRNHVCERPLLEGQPPRHTFRCEDPESAMSLVAHKAGLLETQLRRSKNADLIVTFEIEPAHEYGQPYLRILLPHLHQVSKLVAPRHVVAEMVVTTTLQRLKRLELDSLTPQVAVGSLTVEIARVEQLLRRSDLHGLQTTIRSGRVQDRHMIETDPSALAFYQSKALTSLELIRVVLCWEKLRLLVPQLQSLVQLRLQNVPWSHEHAYFYESAPEQSLDRKALPKLQKLSVSGRVDTYQLFAHILAPGLRHLSCLDVHSSSVSFIEGFMVESDCKLEHLELDTMYCNLETLADFFTSNPRSLGSLNSLRLSRHEYDIYGPGAIRILQLLSEDDGHGRMTLFPQLRSIHLRYMCMPIEQYIDMLHARRRPELLVKLASCTLNDHVYFECQLSAREVEERKCKLTMSIAREYWWPNTRKAFNRYRSEDYVPFIWKEGLEREPEQKERLERLQDDGLEVWM